jgi:hypothetical protein
MLAAAKRRGIKAKPIRSSARLFSTGDCGCRHRSRAGDASKEALDTENAWDLARELEKQYESGALTGGLPRGHSERIYRLRPRIRRDRRRLCGIRGYVSRGAVQVA